jgi:hypothetical protein
VRASCCSELHHFVCLEGTSLTSFQIGLLVPPIHSSPQ